jgi:hypothetical protein
LGIAGVALFFALGAHTPVWRIFYEVLPGISLFRAPSIAAFLFGFGAVTLMAFGIDAVLGLGEERTGPTRVLGGGDDLEGSGIRDRHVLWFLAASTGVLLLGAALASSGTLTSLWTSTFYGDISLGKRDALARAEEFISRGFFLATLLAGATLGLTWAVRRGKLTTGVWVFAVAILLALDSGRVDDVFIQTRDFYEWGGGDPNIRYLLEQENAQEPFKILAMGGDPGIAGTGQDVKPGMYGLELAAGHHPNDLARYRELIGMVGSGLPANFFSREAGGLNLALTSILNVRYVIWPVHQFGGLPDGEPVMATTLGGDRVYEAVYEIPTLPRARLVGEAKVLSDQETVSYILSSDFRPAQEVVLSSEPPVPLSGGPVTGEVRWEEKGVNRLRLSVRSESPALLVLADNWYPAWKARVDGETTPVLRANHSLRAIPLPAGEHDVEVYYDAGTLGTPLLLSLVSLAVVCGSIILRPGWGGGGRETPDPEP